MRIWTVLELLLALIVLAAVATIILAPTVDHLMIP
jgi:hypothetical protein